MKLVIVLIAVCIVGCVNSPVRVSDPIKEGMTRYDVRQRMGKPQKGFVTPEGEVWIYHGGGKVLFFTENNRLTWSGSAGI